VGTCPSHEISNTPKSGRVLDARRQALCCARRYDAIRRDLAIDGADERDESSHRGWTRDRDSAFPSDDRLCGSAEFLGQCLAGVAGIFSGDAQRRSEGFGDRHGEVAAAAEPSVKSPGIVARPARTLVRCGYDDSPLEEWSQATVHGTSNF